jgi:hypothetical protein
VIGRRLLAISAVLVAIAAASGVVVWWWKSEPRRLPLDAAWQATVVTIAGDGLPLARDGDASHARFADPFGVAIAADGAIFIADGGESPRILRIAPDGIVSTLAGGERGFSDGSGAAARFDTPSGLAIDAAGTIYVADTGNNAVRRITRDGSVSTLAGDGFAGYQDGPAGRARFNGPVGVAVDATGRVLVADTYNDRIGVITAEGTVTTLAGSGAAGAADGPAADAQFNTPCGIAIDAGGAVLVADTGNSVVRLISPSGAVTTVSTPIVDGLRRPVAIAPAA